MKLSLDWIKEFVDLEDLSLEEIIVKINASICETEEAVEFLPHLESIVPVRIEEIADHPQADKLRILQVSDSKSKIQIVTAATNVSLGDVVPLALPGTLLGDKKIIASELRGVMSSGMLCSAKELGISDDDSGVLILNSGTNASVDSSSSKSSDIAQKNASQKFELGKSIREQLGFQDIIIDIDNKSITHRPDLWSHFGFAREIAAQYGRPLKFNPLAWNGELDKSVLQDENDRIAVNKSDTAHAYFAVPIGKVKIQASITKFRSRLIKCGIKSISNVVDVSNYLMLECGQPTHFFDRAKLSDRAIDVSFAKENEKFLLLDESEPVLTPDVLLIRSGGNPVAIAGVMGGMESAVFESTEGLVLESAVFKREDVRRSIKKTGIRSDAAVRYEKGLDSFTCLPVINRAIQLLRENGNPDLVVGIPQGFNNTEEKKVIINTDIGFLRRKLGKDIETNAVLDILHRLGFEVEILKDEKISVVVPRYRHNYDVTLPEDLVEEIGRTIGYANIATVPLALNLETPIPNPIRDLEKRLKTIFALNLAFHEVFNYSFASLEDANFEIDNQTHGESANQAYENKHIVMLANEMPAEQSVLRTSIYPSILKSAVFNQDRFESFGLFEIGRTYDNSNRDKDGLPKEDRWLAFLSMGSIRTSGSSTKSEDERLNLQEQFITLRSHLENLLIGIGVRNYSWIEKSKVYFHPHASLMLIVDGVEIGEMGILHNRIADIKYLRKRPVMGRLDISALAKGISDSSKINFFVAPSLFPQGQLDISIVIDQSFATETYAELVKNSKIPELDEVWVHDEFRGGNLEVGKRSVTYRFALTPKDKTFTQERLKEISDQLLQIAKDNQFVIR
ncbi:phenylalanine--tRNA ligase subunit beta [Leptospira sp. GIMC2001]|uniref:phenylalanine--tRNA ligase subunit beta n=1 Tax=Leptospira sp. GIMC2001 TaxID=1513297 RepID=UPI00234A9EE3|nr:phenylalanine--tRNA ligase subunit beta [Leptospira sp. GIMC2001]WCL48814.1 phenylalanine--tRNA ligase subunit beta [Leptospira sp. GIMC2001]